MIDTLEFAWLLCFQNVTWPRDVGLAYKILGNCVAPIQARIVNGWITTHWLKQSFSFRDLWDEYRKFDESISKLADFLFFQNAEWIWWASPSGTYDLLPIATEYIQIIVFAANQRFECKVPFVNGLTNRQILAALYPCNWNKIPLAFHGGQRLRDICLDSFSIAIFDTRLLIEGIGWIQISPFQPVRLIIEKVLQQSGLDISSFQIGVGDRDVDHSLMIAALLPSNLFYISDAFGQRFVNFLTPSVKRQKGPSGNFLPQPIMLLGCLINPIAVRIQISHSTGSECFCVTLEKDCGLSYLQVLKIALQDFSRPIDFELICPEGHHDDICKGPFQVRTFDFEFVIAPYGTERFSLFDRLRDVINRISLKHFGHLIDMILLCNEQNCDLGQLLGKAIDTHSYRISPIECGPHVHLANEVEGSIPPVSSLYKVKVHQTSGCVSFERMFETQPTFQEVVDAILPCGKKLKWNLVDANSGDGVNETSLYSKAPFEFETFAFDIPIVVEPLGIFFFPPFASLSDLLRKVSFEKYGGLANLAVRVNNAVLDMATFIIVASQRGVIRTQLFQGFGGSPVRGKLQTLLVQHGVPQDCSGERAANLIEVCGVKIIEQALAMSNPWAAIKQQATAKKFQLITAAERYLSNQKDSIFEQDPWAPKSSSEASGKGKGNGKGPKKPRKKFEWGTDVIEETTLDLPFLETGKNPVHKISWDALEQGTPGVCVLPFNTVSERRELIFSRNFSASPSVILTIGQIDPPPGKSSKCVFMTIPGWLAEKPVALNCTLIQVGDQPFPIPEFKEITTSIPVHTICMIQVHREEADAQHFSALQDGFAAYIRKFGLDSWRFIDSEWSQSFFSGKKKTDIEACQYFHNVVRIPDKHIKALLRLGGNAGIFVAPKNSNRGIDDRFRVCLLKGLSLEETKQKLQDVPNHLGIAKLKAGYGIRFERGSYQKAKTTLLPDAPSSDEELQHDSDKKFFLLGLPDSFDRCAVRKILREIGWGVGNIQSSGWKTWAVYADSEPPVRDFMMAGTHVVIADGGSSTRRGVFAAGAVRGWKTLASLSNEKVRNAPVNCVTPSSCPTPAPASPGVFETYKTETDGKLQALEMKVDPMTQDIRKRDAVQNKEINDIRSQVATVEQKLTDLPNSFGGQIASLFDKFRIENQKTIESVERRQSAQFEELRELFQPSTKHRKIGDAESRETSRQST